MYKKKKYWDVLDKAIFVQKRYCEGKNEYKTGGIFYVFFLAAKIKACLTIDEYEIVHMTFKSFNDSKRVLDRSQYFDMLEGKKISAMLARSWKNSFINGIRLPTKMRLCDECKYGMLCTTCTNQVNENKEFETKLILLKRRVPIEFVLMLP